MFSCLIVVFLVVGWVCVSFILIIGLTHSRRVSWAAWVLQAARHFWLCEGGPHAARGALWFTYVRCFCWGLIVFVFLCVFYSMVLPCIIFLHLAGESSLFPDSGKGVRRLHRWHTLPVPPDPQVCQHACVWARLGRPEMVLGRYPFRSSRLASISWGWVVMQSRRCQWNTRLGLSSSSP